MYRRYGTSVITCMPDGPIWYRAQDGDQKPVWVPCEVVEYHHETCTIKILPDGPLGWPAWAGMLVRVTRIDLNLYNDGL